MIKRGVVLFLAVVFGVACQKQGYMKGSDLQDQGQGPTECAAQCEELGMRMGALVLVGNLLPGCVCVPPDAPKDSAKQGASGATVGQVAQVVIAAAAAQHQQQQQPRYKQYHR